MSARFSVYLFLSLHAVWALARPPFQSFAAHKVHVNPRAVRDVLLLVDNKCLYERRIAEGSLVPGLSLQHKILSDLRYQAWPATVASGLTSEDIEPLVAAHPCVLGVAENSVVRSADLSTDPLAAQQAFLPVIDQEGGENYFFHPLLGIRRPVVAALIDSGVQADHPDLQTRLWHDSEGHVGFDFVNGAAQPNDDFGHGTHVAGLIGAQRGNALGVRGVMGDSIQLMAVKTQDDSGNGTVANVINGILWAADHGAEVMNISLTMNVANSALQDAVSYALAKNVVIAAAAGNDGVELTTTAFVAPAGYAADMPGFMSVGALDTLTLGLAGFSNFSAHLVEIAAPGASGAQGLLSTFPGSTYLKIAGTSMASPQVAGAAALTIGFLKTYGETFSAADIEALIEASAESNPALSAQIASGRSLNIQRLGRLLFNREVVDASGGFDDP